MAGAKLFISYCREDRQYVERLKRHFGLLQGQYAIEIWDDSCIRAGEDWESKIEDAILSSDLYVCLLSADFFSSEFIRANEIPAILKALETGKSILPIYVGPLGVDVHQFSRMQGLNNPEQPLASMDTSQQEAFYAEATKAIRAALQSIANTPPLKATAQLMTPLSTGTAEMTTGASTTTHLCIASDGGSSPYNIAIIGRTGVGKSELFNYLFGMTLQEAGVGKPVTERGFHKQAFELKGVRGNLFDSWGLEVGNHEEWQKELDRELKQRGTDRPPEEWFHTIIFCIDASSARIQAFEANIIRAFQAQKFNLIVVLTKSDVTAARKRDELRNAIRAEVGPIACIDVGSREEELPFGKTQTFGAEALIEEMFLSFSGLGCSASPPTLLFAGRARD